MWVGWRRLSTESAGVGDKQLWLTGLFPTDIFGPKFGRMSVFPVIVHLRAGPVDALMEWRRRRRRPGGIDSVSVPRITGAKSTLIPTASCCCCWGWPWWRREIYTCQPAAGTVYFRVKSYCEGRPSAESERYWDCKTVDDFCRRLSFTVWVLWLKTYESLLVSTGQQAYQHIYYKCQAYTGKPSSISVHAT